MLTNLNPLLEMALWFAALVLVGTLLAWVIYTLRKARRNTQKIVDDVLETLK